MRRVRFLEHVMGLDGPEACRLEGEVTFVTDEQYDFLARQRTRRENCPWIIPEADDARVVECDWCKRLFHPEALAEHRRFYHLAATKAEAPVPAEKPSSAPAMVEEPEPEREDGAEPCPNCHRAYDTPRGLAKHRSMAHPEIVRAEYEAEHPYACEHCDFRSSAELGLQQHTGRMHPEHFESWTPEKDPEEYPEKCPFCPDRFESVHGRNVHVGRIHMQQSGTGPP